MKSITLLSAFILAFSSTSSTAQVVADNYTNPSEKAVRQDSITVAGRIHNIKEGMPRTINIIECDPSEKSVRNLCELDREDSFHCRIPFSYPHTFTVNYNRKNFINAFAVPGDSIFMDIDAGDTPLHITFSGDREEINRQYDPAYHYLSRILNSVNLPSDTVALEKYMPVFKEYAKLGRDSIDIYARKHTLSDKVLSMLYADNLFLLANSALGFRGRNKEEKRAFFLDPMFDIFNEENTAVMMFPFHIKAIMNHFDDVRDIAPKGTVRDIMFACDEEAPVPDKSMFHNPNYYDRLYNHNEQAKEISIEEIKTGEVFVYINDEFKEIKDENPLKWLLKEYEGHPIYLDVSATWCGPCRAGLKDGEPIRVDYRDSDLKFAIVWLRSSKEEWLEIAPDISNSIQIFIDNTEMDDIIADQLGIDHYPTYMMIDRNGNIIKEGVPRYESPELRDFLETFLTPSHRFSLEKSGTNPQLNRKKT